jgi:hypothetical protein
VRPFGLSGWENVERRACDDAQTVATRVDAQKAPHAPALGGHTFSGETPGGPPSQATHARITFSKASPYKLANSRMDAIGPDHQIKGCFDAIRQLHIVLRDSAGRLVGTFDMRAMMKVAPRVIRRQVGRQSSADLKGCPLKRRTSSQFHKLSRQQLDWGCDSFLL